MDWITAKKRSAEDASTIIQDENILGISSITQASPMKAIPLANAVHADKQHNANEMFQKTLCAEAFIDDSYNSMLTRTDDAFVKVDMSKVITVIENNSYDKEPLFVALKNSSLVCG